MKKKLIWIAIAIVILIILGAVYIITYPNTKSNIHNTNAQLASNTPTIQNNNPTDTSTVQNAEYVSHGQKVQTATVEEKYAAYAALDPNINITKQEVADAIVTNNILVTKAKKNNIVVTDDEVNNFIAEELTQYSISNEEYNQRLAAAGITDEQYKAQLKDQIMIAKLINESIKPEDYAVSDEEVNAFIDAHKEDYASLDSTMLALIKERIKAQMIQKKKTDLLNNYIKQI